MNKLDKIREELSDKYCEKWGDPTYYYPFEKGFDAATVEWQKIAEPLVKSVEVACLWLNLNYMKEVNPDHPMVKLDEALKNYRKEME